MKKTELTQKETEILEIRKIHLEKRCDWETKQLYGWYVFYAAILLQLIIFASSIISNIGPVNYAWGIIALILFASISIFLQERVSLDRIARWTKELIVDIESNNLSTIPSETFIQRWFRL